MAEAHTSSPSVPSALELIDLKTAARLERSGRGGRPPSISTMSRWITHGVRLRSGGRVHLRADRVPSGWRTTRRWLEDFRRTMTADRLGREIDDDPGAGLGAAASPTYPKATGRSAAERRAASQRAGELLKAMGC
jgi:hypothetical protein